MLHIGRYSWCCPRCTPESVPADRFGLADRGRIAPGLRADLLLVEGDPTHQVGATRRIIGVWKRGVTVDRAAFAADIAAGRRRLECESPACARMPTL
jgi:adenine deaminase